MSTMMISHPVVIQCGQCGGAFVKDGGSSAIGRCVECADLIHVIHDIERHMEPGERLVWLDRDQYATAVLCYFTEEDHEDES